MIVGAGLAGLACAQKLVERGYRPLVLEKSERVGGRVVTDERDGFLLDRGFQVLLTAYPAAQHFFDYKALQLKPFQPGALVFSQGRFHRLGDPLRRPQDLWPGLQAPIGTLADKIRVLALRARLAMGPLESSETTYEFLVRWGFSQAFIDQFFRPFFGGVFLERELFTRAAKFGFLFRLFGQGEVAVPARGMGQLSLQLKDRLPVDAVRVNCEVTALEGLTVKTSEGSYEAAAVVLAGASQQHLAGQAPVEFHSTETFYYQTTRSPFDQPILVLNGEGGPVNNLVVMSKASPEYAPPGRHLISLSVVDRRASRDQVEEQLRVWFGPQVEGWDFLERFKIANALPLEESDLRSPSSLGQGHFRCGDHCQSGSIQGALVSGSKAASAVHRWLQS